MNIAFWQLHSHLYLKKSRVIWDSVLVSKCSIIYHWHVCDRSQNCICGTMVSLGSFWHFATTTHCIFAFWKNWPTLLYNHISKVFLKLTSITVASSNLARCSKFCCLMNSWYPKAQFFRSYFSNNLFYFFFMWFNYWKRSLILTYFPTFKARKVYGYTTHVLNVFLLKVWWEAQQELPS